MKYISIKCSKMYNNSEIRYIHAHNDNIIPYISTFNKCVPINILSLTNYIHADNKYIHKYQL